MVREQHCFYCGESLGKFDAWGDRWLTCGARECEREAADGQAAERAEAHEQLDRDNGWSQW